MVNLPFEKESWFGYCIKTWEFIDVNDQTGEICEEEDLLEEWTDRPKQPF